MKFDQELYIPFHFIDSAGILFFGKSTELYHQVYETWLLASGKSWDAIFSSNDIGIPIKHFSADFKKPVLGGSFYTGSLTVAKVGNTSFEVLFKLMKDNVCCFTTTTTHVFMSKKSLSPLPIPEEWRAYFSQYLE